MSEWISVSDRFPENRQPVLMVSINVGPRKNYTTDQYAGWRNGVEWSRWPHPFAPTHWQPLPPPPEQTA